MLAATVTCTWRKRAARSGYQITIRPAGAKPITRQVDTKDEGNSSSATSRALGWPASTWPPRWHRRRRARTAGELRGATPKAYTQRLAAWVYPFKLTDGRLLGDVPVDQVTREMLGQVILAAREQGKSMGLREQIRNPIKKYYTWQIEQGRFRGPDGKNMSNPAADLKFFMGRLPSKRAGMILGFMAKFPHSWGASYCRSTSRGDRAVRVSGCGTPRPEGRRRRCRLRCPSDRLPSTPASRGWVEETKVSHRKSWVHSPYR
jgi:hypothetical protein